MASKKKSGRTHPNASGKHRRPRKLIGAEEGEWNRLYKAAEHLQQSLGDFMLEAGLQRANRVLGSE